MTTLLETQRLVVKAPVLADYANWCAIYSESDDKQLSQDIIKEWLDFHIQDFQKNGFSMCSVFLKGSNEFIGRAGLFYYNHPDSSQRDIEMGYVIHRAHWNKGYATEVVMALIDWAATHLKVEKIIALTHNDNKKSQHILEKVGCVSKQVQSEGEDFLLYEIFLRKDGLPR